MKRLRIYIDTSVAGGCFDNELATLPSECFEAITRSKETERLRDVYIASNVVASAHSSDAHHVAIATVAQADLIVSWNFKHIVHFDKIRAFNAVNLREGYPFIDIRSPKEVI